MPHGFGKTKQRLVIDIMRQPFYAMGMLGPVGLFIYMDYFPYIFFISVNKEQKTYERSASLVLCVGYAPVSDSNVWSVSML